MRRRMVRIGVGLAVVILALLDVQGLVQTLKTQARLRDRVIRTTRDTVSAALPRLAITLRADGPRVAYALTAQDAIRSSLASEFEVFDTAGHRLFAQPADAPVTHWIGSGELPALSSGKVLTVGPIAGEAPRILTYALLKVVGGDSVVVRLAVPASELAEDLRERRAILLGHALSLVILLLVGGLALFPVGPESSSHAALDAYEEAMRRLRERGQAVDREHEEERQRLAHDLEDKEALARAGELTAGIVHEVRNGLGTILGYARLLERRAEGGEVRETAVLIRRECETLESVVRRFMDFVRRETLAPAPFDVGRMLARVVGRESRARPGPRATLEGEFGSISADEELLERAFENLVRNALEAAGNDGQVRIEGKREESGLRIEVRDDGPGMSPQDLEHIRPFYTTKPGGLGLGLAIASKVVELHRGEMLLRPAFPKGLSVGVYLPFEPPREVNVTDSSVQSRM